MSEESKKYKNASESKMTWRALIKQTLHECNGKATLKQLYQALKQTPKRETNHHYEAKIRQTLQIYNDFERVEPGTWKLTNTTNHEVRAL